MVITAYRRYSPQSDIARTVGRRRKLEQEIVVEMRPALQQSKRFTLTSPMTYEQMSFFRTSSIYSLDVSNAKPTAECQIVAGQANADEDGNMMEMC